MEMGLCQTHLGAGRSLQTARRMHAGAAQIPIERSERVSACAWPGFESASPCHSRDLRRCARMRMRSEVAENALHREQTNLSLVGSDPTSGWGERDYASEGVFVSFKWRLQWRSVGQGSSNAYEPMSRTCNHRRSSRRVPQQRTLFS